MSDPMGETPHPDHPHEDEFPLELPPQQEGAAGEEPNPLDSLGLNASTEDFHFTGPAEELDFTEPADFAFPTEHSAEAGPVSESSAEMAAVEAVGAEHLAGSDEAVALEGVAGEEVAIADLDLAIEGEQEEEAEPARELPPWVHVVEWSSVGTLAAGALIAIFAAIAWVQTPERVTLILNICCPLMLALIPYSLWRASAHWVKPAVSALYTMLLVVSVVMLIGGTWVLGSELSRFHWQFNKTRIDKAKPPTVVLAAPDTSSDDAKALQPAVAPAAAPPASAPAEKPADNAAKPADNAAAKSSGGATLPAKPAGTAAPAK